MTNSNPETQVETKDKCCHGRCGGGRRRFWKIPFIVLGFIAVKAALVMVLWNHLIPDIFHGPSLVYWQALGLMILAKVLIGHGHGHGCKHRHGWHGGHHWKRRWAALSDEERAKLREEIRKRCDT